MANPVMQWQIVTPNPDRHARFYDELFGWKIEADNALGYRMAETGPGGIDGGFWPAPPAAPGFVQLFVAVDDMDAAVSRASALGATVIVPPQALPDGNELAIVRDPEGVTFGLTRRRAGR